MNQISKLFGKFKEKINEKAKALSEAAKTLERSVNPDKDAEADSASFNTAGKPADMGGRDKQGQQEPKSNNYIHKITARVSQTKHIDTDTIDQLPAHIPRNTKNQSQGQNQKEHKNANAHTDVVQISRDGNIGATRGGDNGGNDGGKRIFLDYASLTPIDARVKKVMIEAIDEYSANPSSLYKEGVKAKKALHDARVSVAQFFGVQPDEIIFTSGGTESNNLAFQGVLSQCEEMIREANVNSHGMTKNSAKPHFIISTIEHPSIVEIALDLIQRGYEVSFIPVDSDGLIDPKDVKKALRPETVLVSIMYANNEIGTIQPIKEIAREVRHYKKSLGRNPSQYPYMHTDACQAALYEDMRVPTLGIDLLSIDGGKVYGPRSTGVLVRRRHIAMAPLFFGGNQEAGFRAGTENVPSIIGLKHALDIAHSEREEASGKTKQLTETLHDLLFARLSNMLPGISLNGDAEKRLPNNINICFPGLDAEFLVLRLDALGVAVSSVTSCRANDEDSSSYVIEALNKKIRLQNIDATDADTNGGNANSSCSTSSLRLTVGRFTTSAEIAIAIEKIVQAVREQLEQK